MTKQTCYMCEEPSTSREHAPPKCIFPTSKDIPDVGDLRKNLISVPSCDVHNSTKSKDDEYLLYILASSITSNNIGIKQFFSKVVRAANRKPSLAQQLSKNAVPVKLHDFEKNELIEAFALNIDGKRVDSILEKCARALYLHSTKTKFFGNVRVITAFSLHKKNMTLNETIADAFLQSEDFFNSYPALGDNPEVFNYKIISQNNSAIMRLEFYGASKALIDLKAI